MENTYYFTKKIMNFVVVVVKKETKKIADVLHNTN